MYGVLGALTTIGWLRAGRPKRLLWVLLLAALVGITDELHQRRVPNRSPEVKDWIADVVGIGAAATLVLRFRRQESKNVV